MFVDQAKGSGHFMQGTGKFLAEESIVRDYAKVGVAEVEKECGSYDMRVGGREK